MTIVIVYKIGDRLHHLECYPEALNAFAFCLSIRQKWPQKSFALTLLMANAVDFSQKLMHSLRST